MAALARLLRAGRLIATCTPHRSRATLRIASNSWSRRKTFGRPAAWAGAQYSTKKRYVEEVNSLLPFLTPTVPVSSARVAKPRRQQQQRRRRNTHLASRRITTLDRVSASLVVCHSCCDGCAPYALLCLHSTVGGAGGNAINNMVMQDLSGVDLLVCNTDNQALSQTLITQPQRRIQVCLSAIFANFA